MAAPTLVRGYATQAAATAVLPPTATNTNPQVGDLCVFAAMGNATSIPNTTISYSGAGDAGYDYHGGVDGSGGFRCRLWSKVLTSDDFSGASFKQIGPTSWANSSTSRMSMFVFRHADGWGSSGDRLLTFATHNSNVSNGSNVATTSDTSRAAVGVIALRGSTGANVIDWEDGTGAAPFVDESTSTNDTTGPYGSGQADCQTGFKLYDTSDTVGSVGCSGGINNTTHAITVAWFQVAIVATTAQGRGDTSADGRGQGVRIRTASGRGDSANDAKGQIVAPLRASGRGDIASNGVGQAVAIKTASGRGDTATDGRGTVSSLSGTGDGTGYGYAFPSVIYRAQGRGDTVASGSGVESETETAQGRGDSTTNATGQAIVIKRAYGFGLAAVDAIGTNPYQTRHPIELLIRERETVVLDEHARTIRERTTLEIR